MDTSPGAPPDSNPKAANTVWVTDITYVYTLSRFAYLTSVMNLFSRKIIGWQVLDRLSTEHVLKAFENAIMNQKISQPVVIHSDRGVQFVSKSYLEGTPAAHFIHSSSKKGTPYNACIEAFHALIKPGINDLSQILFQRL
ncbi:DDE-type integrase/transposase/recombinase [Desulfosporosinus lacus]|uniref:Integrase core domain-containing protein n=1 Tax=Desulfosporosinus lacus DSM 15449 TaxID=1121420 RepID=A0A1M5QB09_9FIRM|nr:DDE-type integrase/transposase/recombinase [Desulfosporosinus lacus]SHH11222.1 Integrase core domain-containing protein [Desulfosporosinus lacus DSM 15449]